MTIPKLPPLPKPDIKPFMGYERGAYSPGRVRHLLHTYATTYAEAAVKAEMEACAALCDSMSDTTERYYHLPCGGVATYQAPTNHKDCANAIRARSKE